MPPKRGRKPPTTKDDDGSSLTINQLKSAISAAGYSHTLPPTRSRKSIYVDLYRKHVLSSQKEITLTINQLRSQISAAGHSHLLPRHRAKRQVYVDLYEKYVLPQSSYQSDASIDAPSRIKRRKVPDPQSLSKRDSWSGVSSEDSTDESYQYTSEHDTSEHVELSGSESEETPNGAWKFRDPSESDDESDDPYTSSEERIIPPADKYKRRIIARRQSGSPTFVSPPRRIERDSTSSKLRHKKSRKHTSPASDVPSTGSSGTWKRRTSHIHKKRSTRNTSLHPSTADTNASTTATTTKRRRSAYHQPSRKGHIDDDDDDDEKFPSDAHTPSKSVRRTSASLHAPAAASTGITNTSSIPVIKREGIDEAEQKGYDYHPRHHYGDGEVEDGHGRHRMSAGGRAMQSSSLMEADTSLLRTSYAHRRHRRHEDDGRQPLGRDMSYLPSMPSRVRLEDITRTLPPPATPYSTPHPSRRAARTTNARWVCSKGPLRFLGLLVAMAVVACALYVCWPMVLDVLEHVQSSDPTAREMEEMKSAAQVILGEMRGKQMCEGLDDKEAMVQEDVLRQRLKDMGIVPPYKFKSTFENIEEYLPHAKQRSPIQYFVSSDRAIEPWKCLIERWVAENYLWIIVVVAACIIIAYVAMRMKKRRESQAEVFHLVTEVKNALLTQLEAYRLHPKSVVPYLPIVQLRAQLFLDDESRRKRYGGKIPFELWNDVEREVGRDARVWKQEEMVGGVAQPCWQWVSHLTPSSTPIGALTSTSAPVDHSGRPTSKHDTSFDGRASAVPSAIDRVGSLPFPSSNSATNGGEIPSWSSSSSSSTTRDVGYTSSSNASKKNKQKKQKKTKKTHPRPSYQSAPSDGATSRPPQRTAASNTFTFGPRSPSATPQGHASAASPSYPSIEKLLRGE